MIIVKTKAGSIYRIDPVNVEWEHVSSGSSDTVRTHGGKLYFLPEIEVGKRLVLLCPPLHEGKDLRMIETSEIVDVNWGENDPVQYAYGSFETKNARPQAADDFEND